MFRAIAGSLGVENEREGKSYRAASENPGSRAVA
jgi:hypothetical protein